MSEKNTKTDYDKVYLLAALKEAQDTVRSYDTKAQIVGIGFIFTVGILRGFSDNLTGAGDTGTLSIIGAWLLTIGPIVLFGSVLYPSRSKMVSSYAKDHDIKHVYYFDANRGRNFDEYLTDIKSCDWQKELVFELMKASRLREVKRQRFVLALTVSGFSFLIIALYQVSRTLI